MKKKEIEEGNILIAKFLDLNLQYRDGIIPILENEWGEDDILSEWAKWHISWYWLMPVVEKIESMGYEVWLKKQSCWIYDYPEKKIVHIMDSYNKIEAVYKAVVEFIKWYNQQPTT